MASTILFIDGENFLHKISDVVKNNNLNKTKTDIGSLDLTTLLRTALSEFPKLRKIFYAARLHVEDGSIKKSQELISAQRKLRNNLINHNCEFVIAGNVRAQQVGKKTIFREKGVDVRIAVDMVSFACDKLMDTAILCSSDSDLQPAIAEVRKRGVKVIYLGFASAPNKGLAYTTDKMMLFRDNEILSSLGMK